MIALIGLFILFMAYEERLPVLRFTLRRVLVVTVISVLVLAATGVISTAIFGDAGVSDSDIFSDVSIWQVVFAGLEDAVFVLPAFFIDKKRDRLIFIVLSSALFTSGHAYQGYADMFAKVFMIPMVYLMAERWGILTTIVSHSLMDLTAIGLMKAFAPK